MKTIVIINVFYLMWVVMLCTIWALGIMSFEKTIISILVTIACSITYNFVAIILKKNK